MSKPNPIELFVVHMLPERKRVTFHQFRPAFKEFTKLTKRPIGSVALYGQRKDGWQKLYMTETYPSALSEPYINADV